MTRPQSHEDKALKKRLWVYMYNKLQQYFRE